MYKEEMVNSLDKVGCDCHTRSNAVCIVAYDLSGAPLDPVALSEFEAALQRFAGEQRLVLCVTRD